LTNVDLLATGSPSYSPTWRCCLSSAVPLRRNDGKRSVTLDRANLLLRPSTSLDRQIWR
jgi:hypothetical protein